jgi:adenylosuccinate lyase
MTASEQWLERTLDDSSNRRVVLAEAFLAVDGILEILINITSGLVVYPKVIASRVKSELPFMATENILMAGVQAGGSRQDLHEVIRVHSHEAAAQVKQHGLHNDLIERLKKNPAFAKVNLASVMNPKLYIGRSPQQVDDFCKDIVTPVRRKYRKELIHQVELNV